MPSQLSMAIPECTEANDRSGRSFPGKHNTRRQVSARHPPAHSLCAVFNRYPFLLLSSRLHHPVRDGLHFLLIKVVDHVPDTASSMSTLSQVRLFPYSKRRFDAGAEVRRGYITECPSMPVAFGPRVRSSLGRLLQPHRCSEFRLSCTISPEVSLASRTRSSLR